VSDPGGALGTPAPARMTAGKGGVVVVEEEGTVLAPSPGSMILKVAIIGFLMIVLLVPLAMIAGIVGERQARARQVVEEIGAGWGKTQVVGPLALSVPYREPTDVNGRTVMVDRTARFLPEDVQIEARVVPDMRHRSIYDVVIYAAHVTVTGHFTRPDPTLVRIDPSYVLWDDVKLTLPMSDRKGINPGATLMWRGAPVELSPSVPVFGAAAFGSGLEAPARGLLDLDAQMKLPFEITMDLKGTESFQLEPAGKTTIAHLVSPWRDPSFIGGFLPDTRQVGADGFDATWRLTSLSRAYPQAWRDQDMPEDKLNLNLAMSAFGAGFITPVDTYQQTERSLKYGALFILLTFTTFVLVELLQSVRVHPVQYLMVGAALCLFYLLLLSLSEHVRFVVAYACAAAATIGVITMYTVHVLGGLRQALITGAGLTGLYVFLYVLLQLEDYALLTGSIALFLILAFLMFVTRRINWYDLRRIPA
jgi:inner membrane protein